MDNMKIKRCSLPIFLALAVVVCGVPLVAVYLLRGPDEQDVGIFTDTLGGEDQGVSWSFYLFERNDGTKQVVVFLGDYDAGYVPDASQRGVYLVHDSNEMYLCELSEVLLEEVETYSRSPSQFYEGTLWDEIQDTELWTDLVASNDSHEP